MANVLAFCLWGNDPKYVGGMLENAKLAPSIYPNWQVRCYVGSSVDESTVQKLLDASVHVLRKSESGDWKGMFWRFEPMSQDDGTINACISRDTDSRLSSREKEAVDEWLASDKTLHVMRDHPWHSAAIMGGMWGFRPSKEKRMKQWLSSYVHQQAVDQWQTDQHFLRDVVWPNIPDSEKCIHDEFFVSTQSITTAQRFPSPRPPNTFVGQVWIPDDNQPSNPKQWITVAEHLEILHKFLQLPPHLRIHGNF